MLEFARRTPDGAVLTLETLNRHIYPMNTMAIALGMHVRVGIEDTLFGPHGERMTSVQQIEMMVRVARELRREVASGAEARAIYGSAGSGPTPMKPWRASGCRPTARRASAAFRCVTQRNDLIG